MVRKILSLVLSGCGLLTMIVGGVWCWNAPYDEFALCFLTPGYLILTLGICLWCNKYFTLPNVLTISRILLIPLILLLMLPGIENQKTAFMACFFFCLASLTDMFDGWLARRMHVVSTIGKFLDPLADKLIYLSLLVALIPSEAVPMWLVLVVLMRELFITGLRTVAAGEGMVIAASMGGKIKTICALVGMGFLLIHHTHEIDFLLFSIPVNFHTVGLVLTYISLFFCLTSAGEYTYRVFSKLTFDKEPAVPAVKSEKVEKQPEEEHAANV